MWVIVRSLVPRGEGGSITAETESCQKWLQNCLKVLQFCFAFVFFFLPPSYPTAFHYSTGEFIKFIKQKNLQWEQMTQMIQRFREQLSQFPLRSTSRTASRLQTEVIQSHRILQSGPGHNLTFSLGRHKIISAPNQQ